MGSRAQWGGVGRAEHRLPNAVADTPAWVTDEIALLAELPAEPTDDLSDRFRLNRWYLSDPGLARLSDSLRTGNQHGLRLAASAVLPVDGRTKGAAERGLRVAIRSRGASRRLAGAIRVGELLGSNRLA